jgi:hypothetical protein
MSTLIIWAMISGAWVQVASLPVDSCAIGGQVALTQWQEQYPQYAGQVVKMSCQPGQPT